MILTLELTRLYVFGNAGAAATGEMLIQQKEYFIGNTITAFSLAMSMSQINELLTAASLLVAIILNGQLLYKRITKKNKD